MHWKALNTPCLKKWFQKLAVIDIISGLTPEKIQQKTLVLRCQYSLKANSGQTDSSHFPSIKLFS